MKVTYLYHSGFAVELERHILVFDYYKGTLPKWDRNKTVLVFASHKHQDHFNLKIFDLFSQYKNCRYFLGTDIRLSDAYLLRNGIEPSVKERLVTVAKHKTVEWEDVTVETLRSTDAGVAFIVNVEGKCLYHAGDLNWWYWKEEPESWNTQMAKAYRQEISLISGRAFDAAFVPLDPRLEEGFGLGLEYFLEQTRPAAVFPMHMWDDYDVVGRFLKKNKQYADRIMQITAPGQEFLLP